MMPDHPVLYSFRRCPYAIRARLAIAYSDIQVEMREVVLRDKPKALIEVSAKATVPVLVLDDGQVIRESLDIMHWSLNKNDPQNWKASGTNFLISLIEGNDTEFKHWLDRYKYPDRHPAFPQSWYRAKCEKFLIKLESILATTPFLHCEYFSFADAAIAPFIRQFALVDKQWFAESHYPQLKRWLHQFMGSALFLSVMDKYPQWQQSDKAVYFPQNHP